MFVLERIIYTLNWIEFTLRNPLSWLVNSKGEFVYTKKLFLSFNSQGRVHLRDVLVLHMTSPGWGRRPVEVCRSHWQGRSVRTWNRKANRNLNLLTTILSNYVNSSDCSLYVWLTTTSHNMIKSIKDWFFNQESKSKVCYFYDL